MAGLLNTLALVSGAKWGGPVGSSRCGVWAGCLALAAPDPPAVCGCARAWCGWWCGACACACGARVCVCVCVCASEEARDLYSLGG